MLYVFHVDTGTMMTFEMNLALGSVEQLKESIERVSKIPVEKQVLLVSGGECLDPAVRVCSYSAGTDTNPIYLFSKSTLENAQPPVPSYDVGSDVGMKEQVDAYLAMPAKYTTIVARAELAQQFCELARDQTRMCESLVHDQHLQQQGWAAAVANLEDITTAFQAKSEIFDQSYKQHLETREENLKILKNFSKDLEILSKIPILQPLMENALNFSNAQGTRKPENSTKANSSIGQEEGLKGESSEKVSEMTLLMWISAADDQSSLEQMAEQAQRGLEQLDEEVLESLNSEVTLALEASNTGGMKEIKGLEERLFGLEQLMMETKKIVQEQSDLAQSLVQNQTRAGILNDDSILPDLCASHRRQLLVMWQNQHTLCDIKRRCFKAKEELSMNLYHRLGWVMYVENVIMNVTNKLMIYHENLKRLRRYIEIIKQVQKAPHVYVSAVSEVVRRRNFSQAFLTWASDMSCRLLAVYNEEFEKRREFQSQFEGHFLQSLFPGFEDNPPPFATQAPAPFDVNLPELTVRDLEQLKEYLPELPMSISITKLSAIAQMFLSKSISETKSSDSKENVPVEDRLVAAVSEVGLSSKLDETLLQPSEQEERVKIAQHRDDRDFESETDTEEFEKVCQSPVGNGVPPESKYEVGRVKDLSPTSCLSHPLPLSNQEFMTMDFYLDESLPSTYSVSSEGASESQIAPLQENVESSKSEVELLRNHLMTASKLVNETAAQLKVELCEIKNTSNNDKEVILRLAKDIQCHVTGITKRYSEEIENLHRKLEEIVQSGTRETKVLELVIKEKDELLQVVTDDMDKIRSILEDTENQKQGLSESLSSSQQLCQQLQMKLEDAAQEKIKEIQAVSDRLASDYQQKVAGLEQEVTMLKERESQLQDERELVCKELARFVKSHEVSEIKKDEVSAELVMRLLKEAVQEVDRLKTKVEEVEQDKQEAVKDASEKLSEYKVEMENLRSRFKLMSAANAEKSSSESIMENFERSDVIELTNHEAIVFQLKEDASAAAEKAVEEAIEVERGKWMLKIEEMRKLEKTKMEKEKQIWLHEAISRAMVEKNNQIESLLSRQGSLITECQRLRDTVKLLTDREQIRPGSSPGAGTLDPLFERIDSLEKEKVALTAELEKKRSGLKHDDGMSVSVSLVSDDDASHKEISTSREQFSCGGASNKGKLGKISITSCKPGDQVLVVWDSQFGNYMIAQDAPAHHFMHSECLDSFGLKPLSGDSPIRSYFAAYVVDKEYCKIKKDENRYKLPQGTKFYRVKVRPLMRLGKELSLPKDHHQQVEVHHREEGSSAEQLGSEQAVKEELTMSS